MRVGEWKLHNTTPKELADLLLAIPGDGVLNVENGYLVADRPSVRRVSLPLSDYDGPTGARFSARMLYATELEIPRDAVVTLDYDPGLMRDVLVFEWKVDDGTD